MGKMFHFPENRFRHIIEHTVRQFGKLDSELVGDFLKRKIDLQLVGPWCKALLITRPQLLDCTLIEHRDCFSTDSLQNGLLLELDSFRNVEKLQLGHLVDWVKTIGNLDVAPVECEIILKLKQVKCEYRVLNKSKVKNKDRIEVFLKERFPVTVPTSMSVARGPTQCSSTECDKVTESREPVGPEEPVCLVNDSIHLHHMDDLQEPKSPNVEDQNTPGIELRRSQTLGMQNKKLISDLALQEMEINVINDKLAVVQEVSKCLQGDKLSLEQQLTKSKIELGVSEATKHKLSAKVKRLSGDLCEKIQELDDCKTKLKNVKGHGLYLRNKRKEHALKKKEASLNSKSKSVQNAINTQLRHQNHLLQTQVANLKVVSDAHRSGEIASRKELKALKKHCAVIDATILSVNDEELLTRDGFQFLESIEKTTMQLMGECEVPSKNVPKVIQAVSKWVFDKNLTSADLPCPSSAVNMMDRAHILSKYQVAEEICGEDHFDFHSDGTSRDQKHVLGRQVNLASGKQLSLGYQALCVEDSATLLDNVIAMIDELSGIYAVGEEQDQVSRSILEKMFGVMSDRCSVNKLFNKQLNQYKKSILGDEYDTHFLFCNAHFLLGLSTACEKKLKEIEARFCSESGKRLGRDELPKFKHWKSGSESAACRFVRTACDVLGPRGDAKNGCRPYWDAFCREKLGKRSRVSSFRMNRFNNFFAGAAALFYHSNEIELFFTDYKADLNLKLQSVLADCQSPTVINLIKALGVVYYKITGPFWEMLQGEVQYLDQYKYIQEMLKKFQLWADDASSLLSKDKEGIFEEFGVPKDEIFAKLFADEIDLQCKGILENMMHSFIEVTERQLADFLPDGKYGNEPDSDLREKLKHSKLTNLLSENEFGDLDFSYYKRRNASLFYHSGVQMVKRNKTLSVWLSAKSPSVQSSLLTMARAKSQEMRLKHREKEMVVRKQYLERLEKNHTAKKQKEAAHQALKEKYGASVNFHGGPCKTPENVLQVLTGVKFKKDMKVILHDEFGYYTKVLGHKDPRLVMGSKTVDQMKDNFMSFLSEMSALPVSTHPNPSSTHRPNKRKRLNSDGNSAEANDICDISDGITLVSLDDKEFEIGGSSNIEIDINFKFSNQGEWVAVGYDEEFFIGQVIEVKSELCGCIQFMKMGYNQTFKWSGSDDIGEDIESMFVFYHGFDVLKRGTSGKLWTVPDLIVIENMYHKYKKQFMQCL